MTQSNYNFPVNGVSGPGFAANIDTAFDAVVSNNSGAAPPSTLIPRMFWVDTTAGEFKMLGPDNLTFLTLFPDITAPYGGLDTLILDQVTIPGTANFATRSGANTFVSPNTFNSTVDFTGGTTAPTPPLGNSTNNVATTEFVQATLTDFSNNLDSLGEPDYTAINQVVTSNQDFNFPHGFGAYPRAFVVELEAKGSSQGYVNNDRLILGGQCSYLDDSGKHGGHQAWSTPTDIRLQVARDGLAILNRTDRLWDVVSDLSQFRLNIRAWRQ